MINIKSIYDLNNETIECKLNFDLNKGDDCPMSLSLPFTVSYNKQWH